MASVTSLGIASGLDIASLVSQIVAAERAPTQTRLDRREADALSKLSALGSIKGAVSGFSSALDPLKQLDTFQGRSVSTGNEEVFSASATVAATVGRYSVEVQSLASANKLRSDPVVDPATAIGTGTLTISSAGESFAVDIASPANTLADIAAAINEADGNTSVLATVVNSIDGAHLVLTSAKKGADSAITVVAAGGDGGLNSLVYDPDNAITNLTEVTAAADGVLFIDGLEVSADDNVVSGAIDGVTINLLSAEPGSTYDLVIDYDVAAARSQIEGFVAGYNNLLGALADQSSFDAETFQAGPLFGESALRDLRSDVRSAAGGFLDTDSQLFNSLSAIGVTTNLDGTLSIDDATLTSALNENFDEVGRLFAGENGFATQLDGIVGQYLEPTGRLETRTDVLELLVDDITEQREALDERMIAVEARLRAQFTALDSLVGQLNQTSSFLGQQLGNLPGATFGTGQ